MTRQATLGAQLTVGAQEVSATQEGTSLHSHALMLLRHPALPHVLVVLWLAYLGITLWLHALHSVHPPLDDPLSYMRKALNFWHALSEGRIIDALQVGPSIRPHGTIVMSYPFGFTPDYRGFHFRSIYLAIVCSVAAVYIAAGTSRIRHDGWWIAAIALLFSSSPMFYHLDWIEGTVLPMQWGLVDNFHAGTAALSVAMLLRSLASRSIRWLGGAALTAAFTILIKPSGLMIMALVALSWMAALAVEWLRSRAGRSPERFADRSYAVRGAAIFFVVYSGVIAFCVFSRYFSVGNFLYASQVLPVMKDLLQIPWETTLALLHSSWGEALPVWCVGIAMFSMLYRDRATPSSQPHVPWIAGYWILMALWIWLAGAWYWLVGQGGGSQIRYFYPFLLMGAVCFLPAAFDLAARIPVFVRWALMGICIVPACAIGALLAAGDAPPLSWQKMAGVNVSVGGNREEVDQAYAFLRDLQKEKNISKVYSLGQGVPPAVFQNVASYEYSVRPDSTRLRISGPVDWRRGWLVRKRQLVDSDYILLRKSYGRPLSFPRGSRLMTDHIESLAIESWLVQADERSGVTTVSDGTNLRLVKVSNRSLLEGAFDEFVSQHHWRPEFVEENPIDWYAVDLLPPSAQRASVTNLDFSGIYVLHTLAVSRTESGMSVDAWWEERVHDEANGQRFLFLHFLDAAGHILANQQFALFPYNPPDERRRVRHERLSLKFEAAQGRPVNLGFGIYQPKGAFLVTQSALSDFGGRRVLIPVGELAREETKTSTQ